LSVAMLFKYTFKLDALAKRIETAVEQVLAQGYRTRDIQSQGTKLLSTAEMGRFVLEALS